jgi:hypothetical protein
MSEPSSPDQPRCIHLCCKSMAVFGEAFENDPEFQAGMVDFWCNHTFTNLGPDGGELSMQLCSNPERSCYQEF